jgi:hypothetical protein
LLLGFAVGGLLLTLLLPPIPQFLAYHDFADRRPLRGLPNFWNVVTNLPLLLVGLAGWKLLARKTLPGILPDLRPVYRLFCLGAVLTGLASGYYHLQPTNATLAWDRLAMTVIFGAFFAAILGEQVATRTGKRALWLLLPSGALAVGYWHLTELQGRGDLRFYGLFQFLPALLLPLLLVLFPARLRSRAWVWWSLALYAAAKLAEACDGHLFRLTGQISGHSLKHLLAAAAAGLFVLAWKQRSPVPASSTQADLIRHADPGQPGQ